MLNASTDLGIEFVDAPVRTGRNSSPGRPSVYGPILTQLRSYPGKWAKITKVSLDTDPGAKTSRATAVAAKIRAGVGKEFQPGEFDAVAEDGHVKVSYVGDAGIAEAATKREIRQSAKAQREAAKAAKGPADVQGSPVPAGAQSAAPTGAVPVAAPLLSSPSPW